jgi:hypothetical protein
VLTPASLREGAARLRLQLLGEELERLARLGRLVAADVDAAFGEERARLGRDLEGL